MRQVLLLQNAAKLYYKMRQVFYYKIWQFYYKMRKLLLNVTFIKKYVGTATKQLL